MRNRPEHELLVDRDLFGYADALKAIKHQKSLIVRMAFADTKYMFRLTSQYEGSGSQHMDSSASAIADVHRIEQAEGILQANRDYVDQIIDDLNYAFGQKPNYKEIMEFINLYWWTYPHSAVKIRRRVVIGHMKHLRTKASGYDPFYNLRQAIYERLAEVWGYERN